MIHLAIIMEQRWAFEDKSKIIIGKTHQYDYEGWILATEITNEYFVLMSHYQPFHPPTNIYSRSARQKVSTWTSKSKKYHSVQFSSVQFSHSVMSDSLWPHGSQHARPPCPSPSPGVHSDSRPSNQWCHPAISSSVVPFSSCPQSLSASESFLMSQLFTWGGQ